MRKRHPFRSVRPGAHARYIETLARCGYRFIAPIKRQRPFAKPTLALLPFANLNSHPATDYFADGATNALITELARIPAVRVISRQSVLHLKGSGREPDEIARELRVDGVAETRARGNGAVPSNRRPLALRSFRTGHVAAGRDKLGTAPHAVI